MSTDKDPFETSYITIQFQGICTHFRKSSDGIRLPPGVEHRVVLVNAYGENVINGKGIPPHLGSATMPTYPSIPLAGCTLAIENAVDVVCADDPSFLLIPDLTAMMKTHKGVDLGPPSAALVTGMNAGLASCYFDFSGGTFKACTSSMGAVVTSVTVATTGNPQLRQTPFPGTFGASSSWEFESGSVIQVIHAAAEESGETAQELAPHFLLHYLTAAKMPGDPHIPELNLCPKCSDVQTVGVSCSNSSYP